MTFVPPQPVKSKTALYFRQVKTDLAPKFLFHDSVSMLID